jgi:hypothetical protein
MKTLFLASTLLLGTLASGCMQDYLNQTDKELKALETRMSEDYLKQNIVIGKTTEPEIRNLYGKPMFETGGSGNTLMADRIWTYSVRFVEFNQGLELGVKRKTTRSLVFSFKNGVVSSYNFSSH